MLARLALFCVAACGAACATTAPPPAHPGVPRAVRPSVLAPEPPRAGDIRVALASFEAHPAPAESFHPGVGVDAVSGREDHLPAPRLLEPSGTPTRLPPSGPPTFYEASGPARRVHPPSGPAILLEPSGPAPLYPPSGPPLS